MYVDLQKDNWNLTSVGVAHTFFQDLTFLNRIFCSELSLIQENNTFGDKALLRFAPFFEFFLFLWGWGGHLSFFGLWYVFINSHVFISKTCLQMHRRSKVLLWKQPYFCCFKLMVQVNPNTTVGMEISMVVAELGPSWCLSHGYTLQEKPTSKPHLSIIG